MKTATDLPALALLIVLQAGCPGPVEGLLGTPICDEQSGTDAECTGLTSSSGSGAATPTTSAAEDGVLTTTDPPATDTGAESTDGLTTGVGSTGDIPASPPMIVEIALDPAAVTAAQTVGVHVEAVNAAEVTMSLDGAQPVALTSNGANSYEGSIEVYGASMNGGHTVLITGSNGELVDTQPAQLDIAAPSPGTNIWIRTNDVPASQTRAIAVDRDNNVYEVGTSGTGAGARLVVSKRDEFGEPAWPGMWLSFLTSESRGEDIAVGPDGLIYVLGNYQDQADHTRWWLAKLDPAQGILVGEPDLGEIDEPARGLSIAPNGDIAITGYVTVWGKQQTEDVQANVWFHPKDGVGFSVPWGYIPEQLENRFAEVPEDVLITDGRIFVIGAAEGYHPDAIDMLTKRKRSFLVELDFKGAIVREYVAANAPYERSGGYALAIDGEGGVAAAGWACEEVCTQVGEILWFHGDGALEPYARQVEQGNKGPAYALDIAYSPAGYNAVASAVSLGKGLNLALRLTGRRPDDLKLVADFVFDTKEIEMGQAVAVGPNGYLWIGGLRMIDDTLRAVVARTHG